MRSKDDIYKSVGVGRTDIIQVDSRRKIVVGERCVAAFNLTEVVSDFETDAVGGRKIKGDVLKCISRVSKAEIALNKAVDSFGKRRSLSNVMWRCMDLELQTDVAAASKALAAARKDLNEMWKRLVKLGGR